MAELTLLALDTSTRACSVALSRGDTLIEDFRIIPREHNRTLLPMLTQLLRDQSIRLSEIDGLVFGRGPGSFTGLRIATGVVQGLAFGADLPVVPVSTLACLAQGFMRRSGRTQCLVAMRARADEIFFGRYVGRAGVMTALEGDRLLPIHELTSPGPGDWCGVGDGWQLQQQIEAALGVPMVETDSSALPSARDLITLARGDFQRGHVIRAAQVLPVYLREIVAEKSKPS